MKDFLAEGSAAISHGEIRLPSKENEASAIVFPMSSDGQTPPKAANVNAKLANNRPLAHPVSEVAGRKNALYRSLGKRSLDLLLVILALPIALPLILLPALALWMEGGSPFYTQERLGRNGKRFRIYKLRTMVRNADCLLAECLKNNPEMRREWNETQKLKADPRITPVGRFLRMTSLDELPQLWNVFTGEMSLVGPRPMMPEQLPLYGDATAYFAVQPGITGLWQVSTRNESSFAFRAQADADYLRAFGLKQDISLIWRTVGVVLRGTGY
ncbi:bacterial sugar transferase [Roseobacter sp. SK209-2-6]|uniref:sugar transferase n=1 Tax=Roseobacter sp. SK209-2-6 TaxID=388739 RepID=UPI0000F3CEC3|nr:sugar transferase [Roseobacter sp. SK209-2-6]EBA15976.1 bacterial sugar transferase [Roseobacter sp. SK209-2-6]